MSLRLPAWLRWSAAPADASPLQRHNFINVQLDGLSVGLSNAAAPFLPVFLARLGATNFQVGLLTAMPAVAGLLLSIALGQFLLRQPNIVPWYGRARFFSIMAYALTGLAVALAPAGWAAGVVLGIWALATVPQVMTNLSFTVVMNAVAGPHGRYELMSRRWSLMGLITAAGIAASGLVLVRLPFPFNFQLVFILLALGGVGAYIFSRRLVLPPNPPLPPRGPAQPLRARLQAARQLMRAHPAFVAFTAKRFVFLSGMALAAPIFPLYYVHTAHANDAAIGLISTAQAFATLIGFRLWARLSRRRGARLVLLSTTLGLALYPAFTAVTHSVALLIGLAALSGIFGAGLDLVFFDELMKTVPPGQIPLFAALAQSLENLSAVAAPLIGTLLADQIGLGGALFAGAALRLAAVALFLVSKPPAPQELTTP